MSDIAVAFDDVHKKFRRGEIHDSLRDLLPALTGRLFRAKGSAELGAEEFWALRGVSFTVSRGEAFGVIGHNGAGKSTLLKLLSGIMRPTTGRVALTGRLSALIEVGAGFHPDLTGRENVYLNGTILGMSRREIGRKFDEIVAFAEIEEFIDTPVKRYSSGMYARLGFAVAAHVDPDVLIVDEVLSVGDYAFQQKCMERMRAILGSGATVLFVSHNLRAVATLCARTLLLSHGRVVMEGASDAVVRRYLDSAVRRPEARPDRDAHITRVTIRGASGEVVTCTSGDTVFVDVEAVAERASERVAILLRCRDPQHYECFNTSSQRLGVAPFTLRAGDRLRCTFELQLHLAPGTFHLGVELYRPEVQRWIDTWFPAATLFVTHPVDVRGATHPYPRVTFHEVSRA